MKRFGILLVAMVALMGLSVADPTVDESLTYSFTKTIVMEQGNPQFTNVQSGAFWTEPGTTTEQENTKGLIINKVISAGGTTPTVGTTEQTLYQGATANLHYQALDPEDEDPEITIDVVKAQSVAFSGPYSDYSASFADKAVIGGNYIDALYPGISSCGNCHIIEDSTYSGAITTKDGAKLAEGTIGGQTWTSLAGDAWLETVTMDGGAMAYSQFYGDTLVPNGGSLTTTAQASSTHSWNNGAGASGIPTI
jgi:hypothetical protein